MANTALTVGSNAKPSRCTTCTTKNEEVLCSSCLETTVRAAFRRRQEAITENRLVVSAVAAAVASPKSSTTSSLTRLQENRRDLRNRLQMLQSKAAEAAIQVCSAAVENEELQRQGQRMEQSGAPHQDDVSPLKRTHPDTTASRTEVDSSLERLQRHLLTFLVPNTLGECQIQVRRLRFHYACAAFSLHRMSIVDVPNCRKNLQLRGIGKIGGLPLPHVPELYALLPDLSAALRMVANLVQLTARCLGVLLPHPVLLKPGVDGTSAKTANQQDIASVDTNLAMFGDGHNNILAEPSDNVKFRLEDEEKRLAAISVSSPTVSSTNPPSMDPKQVLQRIRSAQVALIAEDDKSTNSTVYALSPDNPEEMTIGVQLLQNNVVALAIRSGVRVDKLWPAQALLLNLYELQLFCHDQANGGNGESS